MTRTIAETDEATMAELAHIAEDGMSFLVDGCKRWTLEDLAFWTILTARLGRTPTKDDLNTLASMLFESGVKELPAVLSRAQVDIEGP